MEKLVERLRKRGLARSTQERYAVAVNGRSADELVSTLRRMIRDEVAAGTILTQRAASKHYLMSELGYTADQADAMLPRVGGLTVDVPEDALTENQLRNYFAIVGEHRDPIVRASMLLLPLIGLTSTELLSLKRSDVIQDGNGHLSLIVHKKKKSQRTIHLTQEAAQILATYVRGSELAPDDVLFDIESRRLNRLLNIVGEKLGFSGGRGHVLNPARLRRTYIAMELQRGRDLIDLQHHLGVQQFANVARYLKGHYLKASG